MPEEQSSSPQEALPKVTAIIVSYNCAGPLRRCLEALERSTNRAALEILVVDKGSQDESPQLDTEYPGVTMLRLPRNFGQVKAMNIGVRTAKAVYILFMPPDVEVEPGTVENLAGCLNTRPDVTAAGALTTGYDGGILSPAYDLPSPEQLWHYWKVGEPLPALPVEGVQDVAAVEYIANAPLMVRKQFVRGMNFFDERYGEFGGDLELAYQIHRASKLTVLCVKNRVLAHRDAEVRLAPSGRALLDADRALGSATFISKHFGFGAGLSFRLKAILVAVGQALASLLKARDVGYHFSRASALLSGQKVDGAQTAL